MNAGRHTLSVMQAQGAAAAAVMLETPGSCAYLGKRFCAALLSERPQEDLRQYCTPWRQVFDADRVAFPLSLRTWEAGDRFQPLGMAGTRKLQDYFVDRGIDGPDRAITPLLCDEVGILWVTGHAMSAEAAVTEGTRHFVEITITPCD
ncbi:MAG: tRNA lysidine(34) synthetase TilS [Candidatus Hydrogenedentes bacterium]|nr:tRNA lysidine(34) synthetase TilS [Candidatus Hydrogenedentota bacterium]